MSKKLKDKVAIITGASKGIGASIAKHFASEGAKVVVNYSASQEEANRVVKEIEQNGGKAIAVQANMAQQKDIQHLFAETLKAFGKLDILVNNAGIYQFVPLEEISVDHFHKLFNLNVLGLVLASQEAAKHFGKSGGSIINISSVSSIAAMPSSAIYSATKAAVDSITKTLSKELGIRNIRVNAVNPGLVETEGVHAVGFAEGQFRKDYEQNTALGRIGQPHDISPAVVFLASDDASWITGETFFITGGWS
jgi:3-oxoacyl-[acyl-carrier protein] reductase